MHKHKIPIMFIIKPLNKTILILIIPEVVYVLHLIYQKQTKYHKHKIISIVLIILYHTKT